MDTGLRDKTVLISGATRNQGRASASVLAAEGAILPNHSWKDKPLKDFTHRA